MIPMFSRRDFLKQATLLSLAPTVPAFLGRTARGVAPERDGRVLVVVQLDGGNDGINTVVPFADEGYAKHRTALRLPADRLVKVNGAVGLHPSLRDAGKLLQDGQLAIVQGVSYPNPNRSHFRSMAIWHTARFDPEEHDGPGWLGRALDGAKPRTGSPASIFSGIETVPAALRGRRCEAAALSRLDDFKLDLPLNPRQVFPAVDQGDDLSAFVRRSLLDAYTTADRMAAIANRPDEGGSYPATGLAERLRLIARLLKAGCETRVFYTGQGGYDTHSNQLPEHAALLNDLGTALKVFLDDLKAAKLADRVAVLVFSEFGRRVAENASKGTDHGTAGPVFLAGPAVQAGLHGTTPSLLDLEDGDLKVGMDFRRIYATVLEEWLGLDARASLGGTFERLPLFRS
jgi:uncharacterized protein (DUF1501 family)